MSTFAVFETAADVCEAIGDLSKAGFAPASLFLVARDLESDSGDQNDRRMSIAQVIDALGLAPAAGSFDTMALVIIPEEGTFLAAGWPALDLTQFANESEFGQTQLCRLLTGAGYNGEEAGFLAGRLRAGAILLGVVEQDETRLTAAREIFADQQAVHVGLATISGANMRSWGRLDIAPPDACPTGVTLILDAATLDVLDATAPDGNTPTGRRLLDEDGVEIGPIVAVAVDAREPDRAAPHYIVVRHGGLLGVGQQEHAIPTEIVESGVDAETCVARLKIEQLKGAPAYDPTLPISRREELAICAYYGMLPAWCEQPAGEPERAPATAGIRTG